MPEQSKQLPVSSSEPPQFAPEQEHLFREVLRILKERQIPFVVSGAFALHEHTGIWRDTKDLDIFMSADQVRPDRRGQTGITSRERRVSDERVALHVELVRLEACSQRLV